MSEEKQRKASDWAICRRLFVEARPYWGGLALFFFVSLLATPVALLTPVPLKIAVDSGLGDTPLPGVLTGMLPAAWIDTPIEILGLSAVLVIVVTLLMHLQWVASALLRTVISERMVLTFRSKLFRHVQRLSFSFHDQRGTSDTTYRIQWDAASIQYVTLDGILPFITSVLTLIAMIWVTFAINWQLGLVALAVSPLLVGIAQYYRPRLRARAKTMKKRESEAFSVVPQTLGALRVVQAFGQEEREQRRFERESRASLQEKLRYMVSECSMGALVGVSTALGTAAVLYFGARQVVTGQLTLGELLLVMSYIGQLYGPLKSISNKMAMMQAHIASADRAFALLDEGFQVSEKPNARSLHRSKGRVRFKDVAFFYAEEGRRLFSQVNFEVEPGARVGIAGPTGAGKTTLISLLMRFYDVKEGAIYLDGVDSREYRLKDLRRQFSLVLQDPVLFPVTIRENIAYGRAEASDEAIVQAASAANAHEFITHLPEGYDTLVGERGMRLSGGERQRISIARAFLADAPILVLDEPTSSVDVDTETSIMEALEELMKGRTTFMIAHRLSTLAHCDQSILVKDGSVVEVTEDPPYSKEKVPMPVAVSR